MPRRTVHGLRQRPRAGGSFGARLGTALSRVILFATTAALAGYGIVEMHGVIDVGGITGLQWLFLALFAVNFAWIGFAACQAVLGFLHGIWIDLKPSRERPFDASELIPTAILAPVYNEDPHSVAAALAVMAEGVGRLAPGRFAVFVLSDSNRPGAWIAEEAVFSRLVAAAPAACPIHYRHRRRNTDRKAGNIGDWVKRWGGGFEAMLVLDADSLMAPRTIIEMARRLAADPGLGLLQTLPAIMRGRSLFARLQQFANRCYGPIFGNGLAAWHGRSSNFWGHNAIIRTKAFADAAGLPLLEGKPPFGGSVLSHDFVEAALLCRAGWGVRLDTDLAESHEEAPPSLLDVMVRDRRWCQGNLQHVRFLFARGLPFASRMHLFSGMMAYLSAPLWFALVIVGLLIAVQAGITRPEYFAEPSLFPTWPVFDSKRAVSLFVVSMGVVLAPKALGWLAVMLHPRRLMRFGGPLAVTASLLVELVFSILYAPILMVAQSHIVYDVLTGRDSGWTTQRRGDGATSFADAFRAHRWHMTLGAVLALVASQVNIDLFFWLLPLTAGLILAPFLSWLSASTVLGGLLGKLAILRTPEERRHIATTIIDRYESRLADYGSPPDAAGPISRLLDDQALCRWHLAQLDAGGEGGFDPQLVLARAKAQSAANLAALETWLTPAECMALLHDRAFIEARCLRDMAEPAALSVPLTA